MATGWPFVESLVQERYYRDAVIGQIAEGTLQITKLVMGRRILGLGVIE